MTSEAKESLEEILFDLAVQKPTAAERAAFLDNVCRDNPSLRAKLDRLLSAHFGEAGFLPMPQGQSMSPDAVPPVNSPAEFPMVGRYKLLEKIGEGGFGEVWMADQREPVKRRVALKIIKLGMDTRQIVARFEAERQALALMDHPNIAKVFDAGATETGRPYFVMELMRGAKITEYCDKNVLSAVERLKLFIRVCQAIQHAHQKGIIHRDIKPSNILVTLHDGMPVPKVIDFGIAKATQFELTDKTIFTQFHQFIGTPAYISPEQAETSGLISIPAATFILWVCSSTSSSSAKLLLMRRKWSGRDRRAASDHSRAGAGQTFDQAENTAGRGTHDHRATAPDRSPKADASPAWRSGLDGNEVPGEGPRTSLRNGQ
jgi:serine/threonine protein kinase